MPAPGPAVRPAAIADVAGLYFVAVCSVVYQPGIAHADVPTYAIGGDSFRG